MILLLNGPPPMLLAQSTSPAPVEVPAQEEQTAPPKASVDDAGSRGDKATENRGSAYRKQKDDLKPFAPSEEIRVDKAVDFPADI
jgi:hypothetical protein